MKSAVRMSRGCSTRYPPKTGSFWAGLRGLSARRWRIGTVGARVDAPPARCIIISVRILSIAVRREVRGHRFCGTASPRAAGMGAMVAIKR